jgi:hypothetical protein
MCGCFALRSPRTGNVGSLLSISDRKGARRVLTQTRCLSSNVGVTQLMIAVNEVIQKLRIYV